MSKPQVLHEFMGRGGEQFRIVACDDDDPSGIRLQWSRDGSSWHRANAHRHRVAILDEIFNLSVESRSAEASGVQKVIARIRERASGRSPATARPLNAEANRLAEEFLGDES